MAEEQFSYQVDAYVAGELSAEERTAFEAQMENDPELAEEVRVQQDIYRALQGISPDDFGAKINRLAAQTDLNGKGMSRWYLPLGLLVIIVLVFLWVLPPPAN